METLIRYENVKDIIIKNIIFCMNVLSSSFTSMQSFLNILLEKNIVFIIKEQPIQQEEKKKTKLSKKLG